MVTLRVVVSDGVDFQEAGVIFVAVDNIARRHCAVCTSLIFITNQSDGFAACLVGCVDETLVVGEIKLGIPS